ncbi:MAG: hypothetical protein JKY56_16500 [Kofleriaceae bacterium]|nr:hypothetical protein [Kofleriaceae bacterium]
MGFSQFGCQPPPEFPESATYVGTVEGTNVVIGIVATGDKLVIYSGGGEGTIATHSRWFHGFNEGAFSVVRDAWTIDGTIDLETASGLMLSPTGETWNWSAKYVDDGIRGVYQSVGPDCTTGVVVLDSTTAQGAWCNGTGLFAEVTPMATPIVPTVAGLLVRTIIDDQVEEFLVQPIW